MSDAALAWLRAQLDDDERVARAAQVLNSDAFDGTGAIVMHAATGTRSVTLPSTIAMHIARWDPARVLAEIDAKRRVLDFYDSCYDRVLDEAAWFTMNRIIKELAQPYADQPGWREEWRP